MEKLSSIFSDKEDYKGIIDKGAPWSDTSFPHDDSVVKELNMGPFNWTRASQLFDKREKVFDTFSPNDIQQGELGDCYLLSAVAALAEFPGRVENIFIQKEKNPAGCYVVRLNLCGQFVEVVLDDYFPLDSYNRPSFAGTNSEELWVMLIEKAWAKVHSNFANIEGGDSVEALMSLTGAPANRYIHREYKIDKLWEIIKDSDDKCYVMCTGTDRSEKGLISSHAYSLINVVEFNDKGQNVRLVQLRNPWGSTEWNGEWSDNDPRWTAELKAKLNHVTQDNGIFYMPFKDFFTMFTQTSICKVFDNYVHSSINLQIKTAFVAFQISSETQGYLLGYELTERLGRTVIPNHTLSILELELYKINSDTLSIVTNGSYNAVGQTILSANFEPGIYVVKAYFRRPSKFPYITLCAYADKAIDFVEVKVADIFEIDYQRISEIFKANPTMDTSGAKKKRHAGAFRMCLAGHRLEWSTEAVEGTENYDCESCGAYSSVTDGWWVCKPCNYEICSKCRPKQQRGRRNRQKRDQALAEPQPDQAAEAGEFKEENKVDDPPQENLEKPPEGEVVVTEIMTVQCDSGHEMKFVPNENLHSVYLCDNCGKGYLGSVRRWFCKDCDLDICRVCFEAPEEFRNEAIPELEDCPKRHKLDYVMMNTHNGIFQCSLCTKVGDPKRGRWLCHKCNFNVCTICKPSERAKEGILSTKTTTLACKQGHILLFACSPPVIGPVFICEKCGSPVAPNNWRWTCESCNFNICIACRPPPEGKSNLICPKMHMLIQSNLPQNNSNYGRCDKCYKTIKYSEGRYSCFPCQYEFCNECIAKFV